jgi:hypothetical protein
VVWLLTIFAFLTLVGVVVTLKALFPKRVGETPYCRKCRYNLTGTDLQAEDARCPECGSDVTPPKAVFRGQRHRRPVWVVSALICLLLGLTPLVVIAVGTLRQVDWYAYAPDAWVFRDLESGVAAREARAVVELQRRVQAGGLSRANLLRLADYCLVEQARPKLRARIGWVTCRILEDLYSRGLLEEGRRTQYLEHLVHYWLETRPVVVQGRQFPVQFHYWSRLQLPELASRGNVVGLHLGDDELEHSSYWWDCEGAITSSGMVGFHHVAHTPGRQELVCDVRLEVTASDKTGDPEVVHTAVKRVAVPIEVLAEESEDYIKLARSPKWDAAATECLRPKHVWWGPPEWEPDGGPRLSIELSTGTLPIGIAAEVYVQFGRKTLRAGSVTRQPSRSGTFSERCSARLSDPPPEHVNIIIRSSKQVAERTIDLFEIWDGELRFDNVEVAKTPPPSSTQPFRVTEAP